MFPSPHNSQFTLSLNNVLFVPSITKNLLSVSQFCRDNSVFFEFHPKFCLVKSQATREVLLQGFLGTDGLYQFPALLQNSSGSSLSSTSSPSLDSLNNVNIHTVSHSTLSYATWHYRLGHANSNVIKLILQKCKFPYINKTVSDFCSSCCLGKAHRLPSRLSTTVYNVPFALIYSDLWGPAPATSSCGYQYYVTFVDACTRFTWIFLLKAKSETLQVFKQFYALSKNQFNLPV